MKKSISMLLAVIMTISVFTAAIIPAGAAFTAGTAIAVTPSEYVNDEITYTISLNAGVKKLVGANFCINFDPTVLQLVSGTAAGGDNAAKITGMYETGFKNGKTDEYTVAYINANGVTIGQNTDFITIKFKAIDPTRPEATVNFSCVEFVTDDGVDNDLKKSDASQALYTHKFKTLCTPVISAVDSTKGSIKVQWNPCVGADCYYVYRNDWAEPVKVENGTSYPDDTIKENVEYTYTVSAKNEAGETDKSAPKSGMYFGAIESATASALSNGIKISWSPVSIATDYDVLRKLASEDDSKFVKITNVTETEYADTSAASGVVYTYSVRAHYKNYTAGLSGVYPSAVYIAVPNLYIANVSNGLQISVSAVGGANTYEIKKSVNGGAYSVVKTLDSSSLSFIDTAVSGDVKYSYTVQAIANESLKSETSSQKVATRLATPALKSVENVDNGVTVRWDQVSADKLLTTYDVYRKTGSGAFAPIGSSTTLSYNDTTAVSGTVYTYTVVAKNDTGCSSYDKTGLTIKRLNTPANIASRTNASGIYVTWNAVPGAESYTIFRNGTQVGTSTTTRFEDKSAAQNTIFKYTIRANSGSYVSAINPTGAQGMNFGTVSSLTYTAIKNGITLTWNKLVNAEGYRVYRKTASDTSYTKIATVTSGVSYNDTQMSSGVVYSYMVEAYKGTIVADMSAPVLSAKYLSVPVFTARNSGEGKVRIEITAVRGADKYVIERADGNSTTYQSLTTLTGGVLEYIDSKNIVAGQKYTYRVRAVANDGTKSFDSVVSMTKMIAPKLTSCYNEIPGVQLKWTAVDGATQYFVYRKLPGQTAWTKIATLGKTVTAYVDASVVGNQVYQYTVEAKTADGLTGYDDIGRECRFLETPDLISRTNAVGGVTIKWNKVAGATSYRIYRRGAGVNYWYYLGDFPATLDTFTDLETANYFPNDAKKNKEAKPKSGNYYRYTVRASYEGKDSYGKPYTIYSGFDTEGLYLKYVATPKLKAVSNAGNGITVTWNAVNGGGSTWYRVYRRGAGSTYWYYLGATQKTSFTDTKIANANNKYYRYTVRAVAGTADKGWYSAFDTTGLFLKRLVNPVLVSAASANGGITVKWKPVAGTTGYYVYRKTASSGWVRVGTVGGANSTTFIDKNASRGVTYTYTVRACYGTTLSSYNTKGVSARR